MEHCVPWTSDHWRRWRAGSERPRPGRKSCAKNSPWRSAKRTRTAFHRRTSAMQRDTPGSRSGGSLRRAQPVTIPQSAASPQNHRTRSATTGQDQTPNPQVTAIERRFRRLIRECKSSRCTSTSRTAGLHGPPVPDRRPRTPRGRRSSLSAGEQGSRRAGTGKGHGAATPGAGVAAPETPGDGGGLGLCLGLRTAGSSAPAGTGARGHRCGRPRGRAPARLRAGPPGGAPRQRKSRSGTARPMAVSPASFG